MYHSISDDAEAGVHPYYRTATSPQRFAEQMQHLHDHGHTTISLADVAGALREQDKEQENKFVVITFDDGYRDFYSQAFPELSRHGFTATVFLPTAFIGDSAISFKGKQCLTWAEVRELKGHGIDFGSHTVTHPQLRQLSAPDIRREIADSRQTIEEKLGGAVDSFAYPYAFPQADTDFTKMLRDGLHQAGYENGVCTIIGRANRGSEPLFMERLPVNSCDDIALFAAKLGGGYDWVAKSQYISKKIKSWLSSSQGEAKYPISKEFPFSSSKVE